MNISKSGMDFITARESREHKAYKDTKGLWTIGIGHLILDSESILLKVTLTDKEIDDLFLKDLSKYEKTVNSVIKVPLTQYQYDALVSFCFNIGRGGFADSTVARVINNNEFSKVPDAMKMWNKPSEIIGRREKEIKLFVTGKYLK